MLKSAVESIVFGTALFSTIAWGPASEAAVPDTPAAARSQGSTGANTHESDSDFCVSLDQLLRDGESSVAPFASTAVEKEATPPGGYPKNEHWTARAVLPGMASFTCKLTRLFKPVTPGSPLDEVFYECKAPSADAAIVRRLTDALRACLSGWDSSGKGFEFDNDGRLERGDEHFSRKTARPDFGGTLHETIRLTTGGTLPSSPGLSFSIHLQYGRI